MFFNKRRLTMERLTDYRIFVRRVSNIKTYVKHEENNYSHRFIQRMPHF